MKQRLSRQSIITTISYKIESLNESKIKVTYEEIYENVSSKEIPAWKQKMAEKQSAKKSKKMFKEVEKVHFK